MRRRSLLALALSAGSGVAVSFAEGHLKAASSSRQPRPVPPLRRGSRLRAINPGTWMDPETDFTPLLQRCAAQGWALEIPESVRGQWQWFSATDAQRRASIEEAWNDPTLDGVVYVGGGWGAARVLESGLRFPERPFWSLGFSDSSALLLAQWQAGLLGAIHGSAWGVEKQWQRTVDLLSGRPTQPLQGRGLRGGMARGRLVVTNLTVATHLIGTRWFPSLKGAILVLEDVGEAPYRVDRMLTQWRSAGLFKGLAGVACGRFSWKEDDVLPGDFSMAEILEERLSDLGVPLVMDLPLGHGLPNLALPLGREALLNAQSGQLTLQA
ncbi:LD-carboxypeptidase family protein [Synechococcus sp. BIOS-E4-1]|uniref:S66 peptidase family protein n=1 Tax=Synechococcus sp. BIOS-E4-1 TaxID=1400864 RepID=UPI00164788D7|nr:LD-carboxypeptidase [Synechococcus sp. BIOS-E4-1]QNI55042.1 LD-carboxypeptidase family protein [Synechococcus sp. BIOS-E4-1]